MPIFPRCKSDFAQVYVSADGYVMPCCWLGNQPLVKSYFELFKDCLSEMSVKNRPMDDILADPRWQRIEQSWKSATPFIPCAQMCGKPVAKSENEMVGTNERKVFHLTRQLIR